MSVSLTNNRINTASGNLGIGTTATSGLNIPGTVAATNFNGSGSALTGITEGFTFYSNENWRGSVGGTAKVFRTYSSLPAGFYLCFFSMNWEEYGDEDAARFEFRASTGTVRSMYATSHEQNFNGGAQNGLQNMSAWGTVDSSSTFDLYLYFINVDGDTDGGGYGGYGHTQIWRRDR